MPSEWDLIEKAKSGDQQALAELVESCWQPLYRFICRKTGRQDEAQDIVQETFYRAFRSLGSFHRTDARFSTYLGKVAENIIYDSWRKNRRTPPAETDASVWERLDGGGNPADHVLRRESDARIAACLAELPEEQRRVVELRILLGLPVRETADHMGKSEAAVKMLQQRALKTLRDLLMQKGELS